MKTLIETDALARLIAAAKAVLDNVGDPDPPDWLVEHVDALAYAIAGAEKASEPYNPPRLIV